MIAAARPHPIVVEWTTNRYVRVSPMVQWEDESGERRMDRQQAERLGKHLQKARHKLGIGTHVLAERAKLKQVTVLRIERGEFLNPDPAKLRAIAEALNLDVADVLERAGYAVPTDALEPATYLRAKYRDLSAEALAALQRDVARVLRRHGIDPSTRAAPGEDEAPEPKAKRLRAATKKGGRP